MLELDPNKVLPLVPVFPEDYAGTFLQRRADILRVTPLLEKCSGLLNDTGRPGYGTKGQPLSSFVPTSVKLLEGLRQALAALGVEL